MQNLGLFISLIYGVICGTTEVEQRLEVLEALAREQLEGSENLEHRIAILERTVADLAEDKSHTGSVGLKWSEHGRRNQDSEQNGLSELSAEMENISKRDVGDGDAFYSYLSSSQSYNTHEIFKFDVIVLNARGGYTPDDGIFDVPIDGVYVFTWTVAAPPSSGKIVTDLVVHGRVKGVMVCDSDENQIVGSGVHPATAVVVTRVNMGDNVYVRMRQNVGSLGNVLSDENLVRTTFSGWRLF